MNGWAELPRTPEGHYAIWRCLSWLDADGYDETGEVEVCGACVPKHSSFRSREDVPGWPLHKLPETGEASTRGAEGDARAPATG